MRQPGGRIHRRNLRPEPARGRLWCAAEPALTRTDHGFYHRLRAIPQAFLFGFARSVTLRVRVPTADGCPTSLRRSKCITSSLADFRAIESFPPNATTPEEAINWAGVCVIVIGNRPHVVIDVVIEAVVLDDDDRKTLPEPRLHRVVRVGVVRSPDNHRDRTQFALGDPTLVIFVIPSCQPGRLTQFAHRRNCTCQHPPPVDLR